VGATNSRNEREREGRMWGRRKRWEVVQRKVEVHKEEVTDSETKSSK
jgi:hypothetical protein